MAWLTAGILEVQRVIQSVSLSGRDLVDIALIALLIYVVIKFLQQARLIPVIVGILSIFLLYGAALLFDLPLTLLTLRSFFGIFLILIAIIFQNEIRRFLALWGIFGLVHMRRGEQEDTIGIITRTMFGLAKSKIGALVILPGREHIEGLLRSGVSLRGNISQALLLSIFDTSSPGHDGAVVVENNQVEVFGAHLPLSEQLELTAGFGLRHRAALGLAERSDALVIVVSEEKGVVSIAKDGTFVQVRNAQALKVALRAFTAEKMSHYSIQVIPQWLATNVALIGVAVLLAGGLWFFANSESRFAVVQRTFAVVPEFTNVPEEYVVKDTVPSDVVLTLEGRSVEFNSLQEESVRVLIDFKSQGSEGANDMSLSPSDVRLPAFNTGFSAIKIDPTRIRVYLTKEQPL